MRKNKLLIGASHKFENIKKEEVKRILKEMEKGTIDNGIPEVSIYGINNGAIIRAIDTSTNDALNESLTIASDVSRMCMTAGNQIIRDIAEIEPTLDDEGKKIRKGTYRYQDAFISFDIDWTVRYTTSADKSLEGYSMGGIKVDKRLITITIFAVNGTINEASLYETLQHEIFHLFEREKMQHDYLDREAYNHAYSIIRNREPDDNSVETMANRIIYISFAFEQRAFTNGAYQVLMTGEVDDYEEKFRSLIKKTKIYKWLVACRNYRQQISSLSENDKELSESLAEYGLTKRDILERADIAIDSMERFIGRVRAKAVIDYRKLHNINEYIDVDPFPMTITKGEFKRKINEAIEEKNENIQEISVGKILSNSSIKAP